MDHQKFGAFSNFGASSHCLNGLKAGPALNPIILIIVKIKVIKPKSLVGKLGLSKLVR